MKKIKQSMNMKNKLIIIVIFLLLTSISIILYMNSTKEEEMSYNAFISMVETGRVNEVTLSNEANFKIKIVGEENIVYSVPNPRSENFKEYLLKNNIEVTEGNSLSLIQVFQSIILIGLFVSIFYFVYKTMGKNGPGNKMQLAFKAEEPGHITFKDIAGNEEAKEAVKDLVDFIKQPNKYKKYGARMPRGIIFYGSPGTGKTLMAKAIAGEADVPFFSVSGSDFVQMYVGVGASRIRDLFNKAHENGKAVIFIDEIDALGKKRAANGEGGNDERDQTLNALLTEMSGFKDREGIIVIAATNRLDILDSALLRPGRFDRQIEIGLPDVHAREKILHLHSRNKPLSETVNLKRIARETVYFSGAMLENLLNEAAIFAAKENTKFINGEHVDKAFYSVVAGAEKKDRSVIKDEDRRITAFHEAGHALVTKLVAPHNSVTRVTIIPSTKGTGGFSMNIPPDKMYYTKKDMESQVMISLGGRAAEEIIFGEDKITTGASNDIEKSTAIIYDYVNKYGMSETVGLINMHIFNNNNNSIEECRGIMQKLYKETKELLIENKYYLNQIAKALLAKETLQEEELNSILVGEDIIGAAMSIKRDSDLFEAEEQKEIHVVNREVLKGSTL